MTTIPDDEATAAIRACNSIPALARLTQSWSADNKRISPFARIVMDVKQAELWRALKPGAGR